MKVWGYTRPRYEEDETTTDLARLHELGIEHIVIEPTHKSREERRWLLEQLRPGDHLTVTALERLSPRVDDLIITMNALIERKIVFRCIDSPEVDLQRSTTTVQVVAALERFRQRVNQHAAKARPRPGRKVGRPRVLDDTAIAMVVELRQAGRSVPHIARVLQLSQTTVHRVVTDTYRPR